ncbi:MAG: hypothetical protein MJZ76_05965 [Bacteroidales bacterium]|nr:hypothetical protein [Bacteroidales bacterium]
MKKFFLLLTAIVCLSVCLKAQTDKMYLHSGEQIEVSVKQMTENTIIYSYVGETMTQEISKNVVEKIVFSSGRTQEISKKIIVNDEDDWENVIITYVESDIKGLVRKGEVKGSKTGSSLSSTTKIQEKAERELKEEAAEMGAHVILIQNYNTREAGGMNALTGFGANAKATISGVAYGYK